MRETVVVSAEASVAVRSVSICAALVEEVVASGCGAVSMVGGPFRYVWSRSWVCRFQLRFRSATGSLLDENKLIFAESGIDDQVGGLDEHAGLGHRQEAIGGDVLGGDVDRPNGHGGVDHGIGCLLEAVAQDLKRDGEQDCVGPRG